MKRAANTKKGSKIIAKIDAKLAEEQKTTSKGEKYSYHDDWTWNDH